MTYTPPDETNLTAEKQGLWVLSQPNVRRSFIFCGAGAILGLLIAGFGLFTAEGTRVSTVPAEDAAVVNQVPILMSDYIGQIRTLYDVSLSEATPEQKRKVLDDMIREELYVQRGVELGLPADDTDVRTALVTATEVQAASDVTTTVPQETELRSYFEAHGDKYSSEGVMQFSDLLVPAAKRADAANLAAALRSGEKPEQLGLMPSANMDAGEEYYFAAKIHLGEKLFPVAIHLKDGDISEPIETEDGVHILIMKRNMPPVVKSFDQAREKVLTDYIGEKTKQVEAGNERFLLQRAQIKIAPELF